MALSETERGDTGFSFSLVIDRASATPAYRQLEDHLESLIVEGRLKPGTPLPPERQLAAQLGISRMTVRRALQGLTEANLVEPRRGAGTFVRQQVLTQRFEQLRPFSEEVAQAGFKPSSTIIAIEETSAGQSVAQALEVPPGVQILRLLRLRLADGEPLELQDAYLPPRFLPCSITDLLQSGSLYRCLDVQFGVRPSRAVHTVGARLATHSESKYLKLPSGAPVLIKQRVTYGLDGRPMEYVLCAARTDKTRLVFTVEG